MKEKALVEKLCKNLEKQGYKPMKEHRRSDVSFMQGDRLIAIEVKSKRGNVFQGLGQAISYFEFADRVWLALLTSELKQVLRIIKKYRIPVNLYDIWNDKIAYDSERDYDVITEKTRYACIFCSNSYPSKQWLKSHLEKDHSFTIALYEKDMEDLRNFREKLALLPKNLK